MSSWSIAGNRDWLARGRLEGNYSAKAMSETPAFGGAGPRGKKPSGSTREPYGPFGRSTRVRPERLAGDEPVMR
jgi:hypothetical protein